MSSDSQQVGSFIEEQDLEGLVVVQVLCRSEREAQHASLLLCLVELDVDGVDGTLFGLTRLLNFFAELHLECFENSSNRLQCFIIEVRAVSHGREIVSRATLSAQMYMLVAKGSLRHREGLRG